MYFSPLLGMHKIHILQMLHVKNWLTTCNFIGMYLKFLESKMGFILDGTTSKEKCRFPYLDNVNFLPSKTKLIFS